MIPHRKRILVVDDSATSLVWQLVLLQGERYDTLTATTPDEGIRLARDERPDLMILDAARRHDDVVAMAKVLRTDPQTSGIPILVLISAGSRGRTLDTLRGICDDQVAKPLQGPEYLRKVDDLIAGRPSPDLH